MLELVNSQEVEFRSLIFIDVIRMIRMSKENDRAIRKGHDMFRLVVFIRSDCEFLQERTDDR